MIEALVLILGYYVFIWSSIYVYSVIKTYEFTGVWDFEIRKGRIGICKYPYWTLFWLYLLVRGVSNWVKK